MATSSSNNEWLHIYQNNLAGPPQPTPVRWLSDVTTTTSATASSVISNQLGRVTRPTNTRRRTRTSRRTPTTLLNTDTTNFRAMVQQFTGGNFCGGGMAAPAAVAPRQPLSSYNNTADSSSGFNYNYGTGSTADVGGYNVELRQPQHQHFYTVVADNGDDHIHQHGFVQQGGGM